MVAKKKKVTRIVEKKESEKPAPPAVRVVTEVVEELPTEPLEEIKQDAQNIEKTVEELEELVNKEREAGKEFNAQVIPSVEVSKSFEEESAHPETKTEEANKVVVEQLFKQDTQSLGPEITIHQRENPMKSVFIWMCTVIVVALLTGGGLLFLVKGLPTFSSFSVGVKPTPTPATLPTPTPVSVLPKREGVSVQVLNGGGKAGAGSTMKKFLESKGYKVVEVGNTDEYNYDKTEIIVKKGKEGTLNLLKEDLKGTYTLQESTDTVSEDATYDARVIVGKE